VLLLEYKADPNIINKEGENVLHIACSSRLHDLAQALCLYGCNVHLPNKVMFYGADENGKTIIKIQNSLC